MVDQKRGLGPDYVLELVVFTLLYFTAQRVGLLPPLTVDSVSPIWPATGLGIAGLYLRGLRLWPGILVGGALAIWSSHGTPAFAWSDLQFASASAVGNTVEAVVAVLLLRLFLRQDRLFDRPSNVLVYAVIAAAVAPAISATIGTAELSREGLLTDSSFSEVWLTWWLGNAIGALSLGPLLLVWAQPRRFPWRQIWTPSVILTILAVIAASALAFVPLFESWVDARSPLTFLPFPALVWAAYRYGQRGATTAMILLATFAILGTSGSLGGSTGAVDTMSSGLLQLYLATAALTALMLAAVVTERSQTERDLQLLLHAMESSADGIVVLDAALPHRPVMYANYAFEQLTGYVREEVIGTACGFLRGPRTDPAAAARVQQAMDAGEHFTMEVLHYRKSGEPYWDLLRVDPIRDADDRVTHIVCIQTDITKLKETEEATRRSEERFRQLAENIHEVFWLTDWDTRRVLYISPAYETIWGATCKSLYEDPRSWADSIHPEDQKRVTDAFDRMEQTDGYDAEYRILLPSGEMRWVHDQAFTITDKSGAVLRVAGVSTDVTEQHNSAERLRGSEERYRALADLSADLISRHDEQGVFQYVSPASRLIFGFDPDELLGRSPYDYFHPDDVLRIRAFHDRVQDKTAPNLITYRARHQDGTYVWVESRVQARPLREHPVAAEIVCVTRDVTERMEARVKLESQRSFLRQILDINPSFVFVKDRAGRFTLVNEAIAEAYGTTPNELLGKTDADFNSNRDEVEFFRRMDLQVMDSLEERRIPEEQITDAHGVLRWLQTVKRPIVDEEGRASHVLGVATDITERKQSEQRQALMMSELDHRVKNNLTAVLAVMNQTIDRSNSLDEFAESFTGRVQAMARTHEVLAKTKWEGMDLRTGAEMALSSFRHGPNDSGITMTGERVVLSARAAMPVCLALHELATNATKYGALSNERGQLDINWSKTDEHLQVRWIERCSPATELPTRGGLGTELITGLVSYELGGHVNMDFQPGGLVCEIRLPLDTVAS